MSIFSSAKKVFNMVKSGIDGMSSRVNSGMSPDVDSSVDSDMDSGMSASKEVLYQKDWEFKNPKTGKKSEVHVIVEKPVNILPKLVGIAVLAYLIAPKKAPKKLKEKFAGRNYAHRGLHNGDTSDSRKSECKKNCDARLSDQKSGSAAKERLSSVLADGSDAVPENSLKAFELASEKGYGVELDVRLTADDEVVVFHDDNLSRVCGVNKNVADLDYAELRQYSLRGTESTIPLLRDALTTIGTEVPIIVELKTGPRLEALCQKTYALIKEHGDNCCIESFDPRAVAWFRKNAPEILRGQLSAPTRDLKKSQGLFKALLLSNMLCNFMSRPHFIAYKIGKKPLLARISERMGALKFAWTSRREKDQKNRKLRRGAGIIFEKYEPSIYLRNRRYKK